jgi:NADH:ubiquinone oxidoreductase subunit 6 (subunit J)
MGTMKGQNIMAFVLLGVFLVILVILSTLAQQIVTNSASNFTNTTAQGAGATVSGTIMSYIVTFSLIGVLLVLAYVGLKYGGVV